MTIPRTTLAIATAVALTGGTVQAQTIAIGTTKGGATAQIAAAIAKVVSTKGGGLQMRTQPFGGTQQYIPVVNAGDVEIGISNLPQYSMAKTGSGLSKRKYDNLRLLANMMVFQVGVLVPDRSDIKKLSDLRGKRMPAGFKAAPLFIFLMKGFLANGGLTYDDVTRVPVVALRQHWNIFAQGKTDMAMAALGTGRVKELNTKISGGIRFVSLDANAKMTKAMIAEYPKSYLKLVKPSPKLTGVKSPIYTMNYDYTLWTNKNVPDKTVQTIVKSVYENEAELKAASPLWRSHSSATMAKDLGFAFHPAAEMFYKKVGIWKR